MNEKINKKQMQIRLNNIVKSFKQHYPDEQITGFYIITNEDGIPEFVLVRDVYPGYSGYATILMKNDTQPIPIDPRKYELNRGNYHAL